MHVYQSETREILKRYSEDRISRAECVEALDCALLALIPDLDPADLPAVQAILAENAHTLAETDGTKESLAVGASLGQPEPVAAFR
jgi:hypothetical protein